MEDREGLGMQIKISSFSRAGRIQHLFPPVTPCPMCLLVNDHNNCLSALPQGFPQSGRPSYFPPRELLLILQDPSQMPPPL